MLPLLYLFAVSDRVLLHRSAILRWVRHDSAAQFVMIDRACEDKLYRMPKFVGAMRYNVLKNCATRVSPRGPSLALRAIHLVLRLRGFNRMCSSTLSVNCEKAEKDMLW